MKRKWLSVVLAMAGVCAEAASAQDAPPTPPPAVSAPPTPYTTSEQWRTGFQSPILPSGDPGLDMALDPFPRGLAAMEAGDFVRAERILTDSLRFDRGNLTVRFYLGVAKMKLGKWDEAKRYLRTPAREWRRLPDPKSHLGVTYAMLGDFAGAGAQRAALVAMAKACGGACRLAPHIEAGIQMIDDAIARGPASARTTGR